MKRLPLYIITNMDSTNSNLVRMSHEKAVVDVNVPEKHKMSFAKVLERDYEHETFGFSQRILTLDAIAIDDWEMQLTNMRDCTMDTCIGIATHDKSCHFPGNSFNYSSHRLLFIEFKLDCVSPTRVKSSDLKRKVSHTRSIFAGNPLDRADIFIFPKHLASPYKNTFNRLRLEANKKDYINWEALSPEEFNNYIAFEEDIPYQPINSRENIEQSLSMALKSGDINELDKILSFWRSEITRFNNLYMVQEKHHIMSVVQEILAKSIPSSMDEDDKEYLRMEFPNFFPDY